MRLGFEFYLNMVIFTFVLLTVFFVGLFVIGYEPITALNAQEEEDDVTPPQLYNIKIGEVSATSTYITWETDELADSLINYGLDKNYGILREPRFDKLEHMILLEDLLPGMDYYFRVTSSDEEGNQGISNDYSFRTPEEEDFDGKKQDVLDEGKDGLSEDVAEEGESGDKDAVVEQTMSLDQVMEFIEQITQQGSAEQVEEVLEEIVEEVQQKAEEVVAPPTIILDYADVEVGTDYAIITWMTDKESNSMVSLVSDDDFDANSDDPYVWNEGEPDEYVLEHIVEINGLDPSTVYHFQVSSESEIGLKGYSEDKTFKTKSVKPEIYNLQISKVEEESATIRLSTNVPCSSIIEYTNLNNNDTKLEGNSSFITVHSMKLDNLIFDTYYSAMISVESEDGEKAESDPITFITTRDEYAPVISKVSTESTIYPGSDNKIQTIASWSTDEPALCQFFYQQGLFSNDEPLSLTKEEDMATKHVQVVTNFIPSTVYKFWIVCEDEAENQAKSEDFTMLTPTQEESIIDIILKNFESSFGWVKKMGI